MAKKYVIIGNGRLGAALSEHFRRLNVDFTLLSKKNFQKFQYSSQPTSNTIFLICTPDRLVKDVHDQLISWLPNAFCIHFSGSIHIEGLLSYHPLYTFNGSSISNGEFDTIPFVGIKGQPHLSEIFPFLSNNYIEISSEQKQLYHSTCVLASNLTAILCEEAFRKAKEVGLPHQLFEPILKKTISNLMESPSEAATGPISRGDMETIKNNLQALSNSPISNVYLQFLKLKGVEL